MNFRSVLFLSLLTILQVSCSVKHEPIRYGTDSCDFCKMLIMDNRYGAEIVTTKGKVYKFDDINCLVLYIDANVSDETTLSHRLVTDYNGTEQMTEVEDAFFIHSEFLRTPMASQVVAFLSEADKNAFLAQSEGKSLSWTEVREMFK